MKRITTALMLMGAALGCATSANDKLESARFALDGGNWGSAITSAGEVLAGDPSDVEAALLLSSGYAGRAGIRILSVSSDIADADNSDNEFDVVHDSLVDTIADLGDLRLSITSLTATLDPQPTDAHDLYADQQFQTGMLEAIEAFGLSSIHAQPTADGPIAVTDITSEDKDNIQNDLINADDHLIASGMEETDDLVKNIRKNYCVLKNASTAASGFDLAVIRDLNLCQLSTEDERNGFTAANFQSPTITSCDDFDFDACENAGDSTP